MNAASEPVADAPPVSDHLTDNDRLHLKTYLRLLDAAADDADWREVASVVLGLDPRGRFRGKSIGDRFRESGFIGRVGVTDPPNCSAERSY